LRRASSLGPDAERKGFTLVEVIVVLVILAILMSIAVPALTGYIDKARDKKWEMTARDVSIAVRSVITETYAKEGFLPYAENGESIASPNFKEWDIGKFGGTSFYEQVSALSGLEWQEGGSLGYWDLFLAGSPSSTAYEADGFLWWYFPEGSGNGKPYVLVTYKMDRLDVAEGTTNGVFWPKIRSEGNYNPNAGYEVYHLKRG
jgi:prepilin-type N-terminal cleavage/methylation domain-containing protein